MKTEHQLFEIIFNAILRYPRTTSPFISTAETREIKKQKTNAGYVRSWNT